MLDSDIYWLHVEASTKCNAWCPACPRNKNGFGIADNLIEEDLAIARFIQVLDQLPNLHGIQFCGNYGDPIIANNILDLISVAMKYAKKIQIHTNGSLRSTDWWRDLAALLENVDHDVWFGIDGLSGVHEIYRQGTDYNKVINNATSFINAGGVATWQFIPYAHNEHQIRDCLKTSQKLGFRQFKLIKSFRDITDAKHYRTGDDFKLFAPKEIKQIIQMPKAKTKVDPVDCMHLTQPGIYLGANGKLSYCCYHHNLQSAEKQFDSLQELLYNNIDLQHEQCVISCGK